MPCYAFANQAEGYHLLPCRVPLPWMHASYATRAGTRIHICTTFCRVLLCYTDAPRDTLYFVHCVPTWRIACCLQNCCIAVKLFSWCYPRPFLGATHHKRVMAARLVVLLAILSEEKVRWSTLNTSVLRTYTHLWGAVHTHREQQGKCGVTGKAPDR